jgi:hypothetical protein
MVFGAAKLNRAPFQNSEPRLVPAVSRILRGHCDGDRWQLMTVACQDDRALKRFEFLLRCPVIPNMQEISARQHIGYRNMLGSVGHSEEAGVHRQDHSHHVRMQLAEDIRGTDAVKAHRFLLPPWYRPRSKGLPRATENTLRK